MKPILIIYLGFLLTGGIMAQTKSGLFESDHVLQIGIIVEDIDSKSAAWAEMLGIEKPEAIITDPVSEAHTKYWGESTEAQAKLAFINLDNIQIELIEPIGGPSTWRTFLDKNGEGVHHIAFKSKDVDMDVKKLDKLNMPLEQSGDYPGGCYRYIDSQKSLGVILELLADR